MPIREFSEFAVRKVKINVKSKSANIGVPYTMIEQLGWKPGQNVRITIKEGCIIAEPLGVPDQEILVGAWTK